MRASTTAARIVAYGPEGDGVDPLKELLRLSGTERAERGLEHTPAEIAQQPGTWITTFDRLHHRQTELQNFLSRVGLRGEQKERPVVFLIGAGTSDYIGRSLDHLLRSRWQCEVIPVASTSLLIDFSDYVRPGQRYLWISFSRSGDSPEGVAVLERALAECDNISHLLVTCNARGRMNKAVDGRANCLSVVLDEATNDRGLAMTSSFTNMVVAGQVLAHVWSMEEYETILRALISAGESFLPRAARLASDLAHAGYERVCFVGSGALAGTALECALKVLELTAGKVQTMSQPSLALRHGPMAALDGETLLVALVSSQAQRRQYEVDLLREIGSKDLVRTRVAVATDTESLRAEADFVLTPETPDPIPDLYRPVLDVIFGQLLGLFASIQCGLKPDLPSPNGAISRVVQNVDIY
jgi:tagatose-6-phosphate ketose/aldose isomerase